MSPEAVNSKRTERLEDVSMCEFCQKT